MKVIEIFKTILNLFLILLEKEKNQNDNIEF